MGTEHCFVVTQLIHTQSYEEGILEGPILTLTTALVLILPSAGEWYGE